MSEQQKTVSDAVKAITHAAEQLADKAWREYMGILDLQERIAKKAGNISQFILALAKDAVASTYQGEGADKLSPESRVNLALSRFNAGIAAGVAHAQEKHADADKLLVEGFTKTWNQYASNMRGGIKVGLDPRDFESETAFRNETQKFKKKGADAGKSGETATTGMTEEQKETVKETQQSAVAVAKTSDKIAQAVASLLQEIKGADVLKHEDAILAQLDLCRAAIHKYTLDTGVKATPAARGMPATVAA